MGAEGIYYSGGAKRHQLEGGSLQEGSVEFDPKSFSASEKSIEASHVAEILKHYKFGQEVAEFMKNNNVKSVMDLEILPIARYEAFIFKSQFPDGNPALAKVVAKEILKDRSMEVPSKH